MKFLVELGVTAEAGAAVEARPGGPGPVIENFIRRFKPEAVYMGATKRVVFMVIDFEDEASVAEYMVAGTTLAGAYPKFTAVVSGEEFGPLAEQIMGGARALLST